LDADAIHRAGLVDHELASFLASIFAVRRRKKHVGIPGCGCGFVSQATRTGESQSRRWFGIAHTIAFVIASTVVAFPLAFAELLPAAWF